MPEGCPTSGETLVTARCGPGEPKGSHLGSLFIGSEIIDFHPYRQIILVPSRAGYDAGSRSFRYVSQETGVSDAVRKYQTRSTCDWDNKLAAPEAKVRRCQLVPAPALVPKARMRRWLLPTLQCVPRSGG